MCQWRRSFKRTDGGHVSSSLETLATAYVASFNPEHEKWNGYPDGVRKAIEVFNLLNIKPMRPLLLAISVKFGQKQAAAAFNFLVSLGVRLLIASTTRSSSVELPLAAAANDVFTDKYTTFADLKKHLAGITPNDTECFGGRASASLEVAACTVLSALVGNGCKNEAEPWFIPMDDRAIINLEHVLPKKPTDKWPQFTDDEAALYANRLGNQALLRASDNSNLQSIGFADKKKVYAASPYILTSQIAGLADWNPAAIAKRQKALAALAAKAWPI